MRISIHTIVERGLFVGVRVHTVCPKTGFQVVARFYISVFQYSAHHFAVSRRGRLSEFHPIRASRRWVFQHKLQLKC